MRYILLLMLLVGCDDHARNEDVIKESKKCTDAGMDYLIGDWGRVFCSKPTKDKP
jgi:hypothetical protein